MHVHYSSPAIFLCLQSLKESTTVAPWSSWLSKLLQLKEYLFNRVPTGETESTTPLTDKKLRSMSGEADFEECL